MSEGHFGTTTWSFAHDQQVRSRHCRLRRSVRTHDRRRHLAGLRRRKRRNGSLLWREQLQGIFRLQDGEERLQGPELLQRSGVQGNVSQGMHGCGRQDRGSKVMNGGGPRLHGFGLGLRPPHYRDVLERDVRVDFFEVISENFMIDGGKPRDVLRRVRERHPIALHGVSMSIGSADGLDESYLHRLRTLIDETEPLFVSDHLCWSRSEGFSSHDLLPLPYTEEALELVCANIHRAQEVLGRTLLIENPSSYVTFAESSLTEWE